MYSAELVELSSSTKTVFPWILWWRKRQCFAPTYPGKILSFSEFSRLRSPVMSLGKLKEDYAISCHPSIELFQRKERRGMAFSPCCFGHLCWEISCWCTWEMIPWTFPVRKVAWIWGLNKSAQKNHTKFQPFLPPPINISLPSSFILTKISLRERESGDSL